VKWSSNQNRGPFGKINSGSEKKSQEKNGFTIVGADPTVKIELSKDRVKEPTLFNLDSRASLGLTWGNTMASNSEGLFNVGKEGMRKSNGTVAASE